MACALIIVDMLNDFIRKDAPLEVPLGREIIVPIRRLLKKARECAVPVIYLCDRHLPSDPEFKVWPSHAVLGSNGSDVIDELSPRTDEIVIPKRRYSGFFGTDLDLTLRERSVCCLVITGVLTNICVLYTTVDAAARGYRVIIPQDCVAALTEDNHRWALENMRGVAGAQLTTSTQAEDLLSENRRSKTERCSSSY